MKGMGFRFSVVLLPVILGCTISAHAALLGADIRLDTDAPGYSSSCLPQMTVTDRGRVYAVWQDLRGTSWRIYSRSSANLGRSWPRPDAPLSTWGNAENPRIAADDDGNIYVVWEAFTDTESRIGFNRSRNYGATWLESEQTLSSWNEQIAEPVVACDSSGHVYVAWVEYDGSSEHVFFTTSADYGQTWLETPVRINTNAPGTSWSSGPRLSCDDGGNAYIGYVDNRNGTPNVFFRRSTGYGHTWEPTEVQVDTGLSGAGWLSLVADDIGRIHLAWATNNANLWSNSSIDNGTTWQATPVRLDGHGATATLAAQIDLAMSPSGTVYATYIDRRTGGFDIYANVSLDDGATWTRERTVATAPADLFALGSPRITCDPSNAYVVWMDAQNGYFDIYFALTNDTGLSWTAPVRINTNPPGEARSAWPKLVVIDGRVPILWDDRREGEGAPDTYCNLFTTSEVDASNTSDTDGDGLFDGDETDVFATSAAVPDTDGDGLDDGAELSQYMTDPISSDTDADGFSDADEVSAGTDPLDSESFPEPASCGLWEALIAALIITGICALLGTGQRKRAACAALVLTLSVCGTGAALQNDQVTFTFTQTGTSVELTSLTATDVGTPITMQAGAGAWEILLREKGNYANTHTLHMDGTGATSLTLDSYSNTDSALAADWSGSADFVATTSAFEVKTRWELETDKHYADTTIQVTLTTGGELPFYVSEIHYPILHVTRIASDDVLLIPVIQGYLYADPINNGVPALFNIWATPLSVPVFAYYSESSKNCLYLSDNDTQGWWRTMNVSSNAPSNRLEFRIRHVPDNIFENKDFVTPYSVRLAALKGDWVDAARLYRQFLVDECPWYQGPVASPSHPMPEAMKRLVAEVQVGTNYPGDNMDTITRDIMRMVRVYGDGIYTRWYGAHWPDTFDAFYNEGYLPGRPSFAAAIRESEKPFACISAPYIQGSLAYDYSVDPGFSGTPTETNLNAYDSAVILEDGSRASPLFALNAFMCNRAAWWETIFPQNVVDIAEFTHMHGAYLDYFGAFICFSTEHNHAPGGGSYPLVGRMDHVRDIKAGVAALPDAPEYFGISMESVHGRYSEEVDLMFLDPLANFSGSSYAISVPFFRYVHDNVKLSKITGVGSVGTDPGYNGWIVGSDVFTFGQIIGSGSTVSEGVPSFFYRPLVPFYRFEKKVCEFLRDRSFFTWHNGTMERIPDFTVTNAAGFSGQPGADPGNPNQRPLYMEEVLTPGMFRAIDGSLAFVLANPWVGSDQRDFDFTAAFDPTDYPGFSSTYTVTKVDDSGNPTDLGAHSGSFVINDTVNTGHIVYWVFRGAT